jgi:hypothetical protein
MPKGDKVDYENTPVSFYKFYCNDPEITSCYVGHTTNFRARKYAHKTSCNNNNDKSYNVKLYQTIRGNGGWDNWKMVEIEKRISINKRDAEKYEQELINKFESDLNTQKAYNDTTKKDANHSYYMENIDKIKERIKIYQSENNDKIIESRKVYRDNNKEQLKKKNQLYYEANAENIKSLHRAYSKEYRQANRDTINQKQRERRAILKAQAQEQVVTELDVV